MLCLEMSVRTLDRKRASNSVSMICSPAANNTERLMFGSTAHANLLVAGQDVTRDMSR